MNTEIVAALETYYPEEPTVEQILDRVHDAIEMAQHSTSMPYRRLLIEALDQLSLQVATGMEPDQFRAPHTGHHYRIAEGFADRYRRWKRVQKHGVETADFERELHRGMLNRIGGKRAQQYLRWFAEGRPDLVLRGLRLSETKFVDKDAVLRLLQSYLHHFFRENWGDPEGTQDWDDKD